MIRVVSAVIIVGRVHAVRHRRDLRPARWRSPGLVGGIASLVLVELSLQLGDARLQRCHVGITLGGHRPCPGILTVHLDRRHRL